MNRHLPPSKLREIQAERAAKIRGDRYGKRWLIADIILGIVTGAGFTFTVAWIYMGAP